MNFLDSKKMIIGSILLVIVIFVTYFLDRGLSMGICFVTFLSVISVLFFRKFGFIDKKIYLLFFITLLIHLGATFFMHYANFQPFSGGQGDYVIYQKTALEISHNFRQGNFSLKDLKLEQPKLFWGHYYAIIVGMVYTLTLPEEIIGLMFNSWLVAISIILVYLIILEVGGAVRSAFLAGILITVYPSYVFATGLLLKEATEIFFVMLGMLVSIKIIKEFNWYRFCILYFALFCATHFRFYVGYALIATFVLSWFLFSNIHIKKRVLYGLIFIALFGFIPYFATEQGYYGMKSFKMYLNSNTVDFYRKVIYVPKSEQPATRLISVPKVSIDDVEDTPINNSSVERTATGLESSFIAESTPIGYIKSFMYVFLGPFPWQIKNLRQTLALVETIPWYLILFFIFSGIIVLFKNKVKEAAPLLIFSIITLVVMAIFNSNFGIITRIRIPVFISLICLGTIGLEKNSLYNYLDSTFHKLFFKKS